ncbi:MAG TPA: hypothetical protein VGB25_10140 [Candidatus Binatia bacterium]
MEREKVREKEPEQKGSGRHYEETLQIYADLREHAKAGRIVIRAKDIPWRQNRQALVKTFLSSHGIEDTAATDWICFVHDVKVHSGKHRHQGGIQLFVLEGDGYTVVDGERFDWEKWDLIILPVKPRGCEHQHFNKEPGKPAKWMAFQYDPFNKPLGNMFEQVENSPDWKSKESAPA